MYPLKIGLVAFAIGVSSVSYAQVVMKSSVLGSGATASVNGSVVLAATIGQPLIGISGGAQIDRQGFWYTVHPQIATAVEGNQPASARAFALSQNYPNPFSVRTQIDVTVPSRSRIRLTLFDNLGREVKELLDGEFEAGVVAVHLPAAGLRPGQYVVRLDAGTERRTVRLSVVK